MSIEQRVHQALSEAQQEQLPAAATCRAIRLAAGLTQAELAEALRVSRSAVSRWESGRRQPQGQARAEYTSALAVLLRRASEP